jgi:hypothetical protein
MKLLSLPKGLNNEWENIFYLVERKKIAIQSLKEKVFFEKNYRYKKILNLG